MYILHSLPQVQTEGKQSIYQETMASWTKYRRVDDVASQEGNVGSRKVHYEIRTAKSKPGANPLMVSYKQGDQMNLSKNLP
jgi:hypothetical protein